MTLPSFTALDAEVIAEVARRYLDERHYPKRTCLGCGGSLRAAEFAGYAQCDSRGVEVRVFGEVQQPGIRLTYAQLRTFAEIAKVGEQESLGL